MNFSKIYDETVNETLYFAEHESGLKVYAMPKSGFSKSYAVFGTKFGSIDSRFKAPGDSDFYEVPDGVAHFLEHKMFEQPDGSNVFESYARHGANANAYTSFNLTAYLFEATSDLYDNLKILLEFVSQPFFTDENVSKEQGIIGQEIGMYDDDPGWRVMMNFLSSMYGSHPVRKDIAGTVESIAKIDKDVLYKCYNTFYDLSNMALFVIGDLDVEKIGACVDGCVKKSEKPQGEIIRDYGSEQTSVLRDKITQKLSLSVPTFMFGFKDNNCGFDGKPLLKKSLVTSIAANIIFGKSGKLANKLYNEGYILGDLDVEVESEAGYGFTALSGESNNPDSVKQVISEELKKFYENGVDAKDFERSKRSFYGKYIRQFDSISSVAHSFMSNCFNNIGIFDAVKVLDEITISDVNERIKEHFVIENSVLSVVEPI